MSAEQLKELQIPVYIQNGDIDSLVEIIDYLDPGVSFNDWLSLPAEKFGENKGRNRLTFAAENNFTVLEEFGNYGADFNLVDKSGLNALCFCKTSNQIAYLISMGANPNKRILEAKTDEGRLTWIYPAQFMIEKNQYQLAEFLIDYMEKEPPISDPEHGFFAFLNDSPGAFSVVKKLCDLKFVDHFIPFRSNGVKYQNCGTTLLSRMAQRDSMVSIQIVDYLCRHQNYPSVLGADMMTVGTEEDLTSPERFMSVIDRTAKNKNYVHLPSLYLKSSMQIGIEKTKLIEFGRYDKLRYLIQNNQVEFTRDELIEKVKFCIENTQDADTAEVLLAALQRASPNINPAVPLGHCYQTKEEWQDVTRFTFASPRKALWEFFVRNGACDFSDFDLSACIPEKETGIEVGRFKELFEKNAFFGQMKGYKERMLPPLDDMALDVIIFENQLDILRLVFIHDLIDPLSLEVDEEADEYLGRQPFVIVTYNRADPPEEIRILESDDDTSFKGQLNPGFEAAYKLSEELRDKKERFELAKEYMERQPRKRQLDMTTMSIVSHYVLKKRDFSA